ncbi:SDR family oxidoreductase [Candidatus Peregrinibacteria bacterium]|nr:SDR family oxidoreductase [Candidatus Peregrinibacteria bacterium]
MKTALITGGAGGIGNPIVKLLSNQGFQVIIWGRDKKKFDSLYSQLSSVETDRIVFHSIDVRDPKQVKEGIQRLKALDTLINMAGVVWPIGKAADVDLEKFKMAFDINFFGTLYACVFAIPLLLKSPAGKIINFAGGGSAYARENHSAYGCSKTAIVRLTENLGLEYPQLDINTLAPGAHKTPMWNDETFDQEPKQWSDMDELIAFIDFLFSDRSKGITGKFLHFKDKIEENSKNFLQNSDLYTLRRIDDFQFFKLKK